ncbi:hypothetical protein B0H13DRAFT_428002 [Mycena leptocephala]|nr:hypothetical protein B0H13DRAFT_428002 [Mycena leptocephala]
MKRGEPQSDLERAQIPRSASTPPAAGMFSARAAGNIFMRLARPRGARATWTDERGHEEREPGLQHNAIDGEGEGAKTKERPQIPRSAFAPPGKAGGLWETFGLDLGGAPSAAPAAHRVGAWLTLGRGISSFREEEEEVEEREVERQRARREGAHDARDVVRIFLETVGSCGLGVEWVVGVGDVGVGWTRPGAGAEIKGRIDSIYIYIDTRPVRRRSGVPAFWAVPVQVSGQVSVRVLLRGRRGGGGTTSAAGARSAPRVWEGPPSCAPWPCIRALGVRVPCAREIGGRTADWACAREVYVWAQT